MKRLYFILLSVLFFSNPILNAQEPSTEIKPYIDFLKKNQPVSAKEYILSLFQKHDVVILCERDHRELTQYDLILDVARDPYFREHAGVIFSEIGSHNLNPELNNFLQDGTLDNEQVKKTIRHFQRNIFYYPVWEKYNWSYFAEGLYAENHKQTPYPPIQWYPSDLPYYIKGNATPEQISKIDVMTDQRDSLIADHVIQNLLRLKQSKTSQKALVILNYRHAYGPGFRREPNKKADNASRYIYEAFPGLCCNVMLNSVKPVMIKSDTDMALSTIQDGKWDAAFQYTGITNAGFDFEQNPFGEDLFDYFPINVTQQTYADVFDGFVFYTPIASYKIAIGIPHIAEEGFAEEYAKREKIKYESVGRKSPGRAQDYLKSINELKIQKEDFYDELIHQIEKWLHPAEDKK